MDIFNAKNIDIDSLRLKSFPFNKTVEKFVDEHEFVFVVEQNRDAQMRTLLINELGVNPDKMIKILNYDGTPITADLISEKIEKALQIRNPIPQAS